MGIAFPSGSVRDLVRGSVLILLLNALSSALWASPVSINGKLHVTGYQLMNSCGNPVQLRGWSSHGIQWFGYGNCLIASSLDFLAYDVGADVFRIAMYVDEGGYLTDPTGFTNQVNALVTEAGNRGMYCIIDWHILNPGNPNTSIASARTFWTAMANAHHGKDHVLYEICNEPNNVTWAVIKQYADDIIPRIRAIDPDTVIICGTPDWSKPNADVVNNPLSYPNIMYAIHFYAGSHTTAIMEPYLSIPLFASEWGVSNTTGNGGDNYTNAQTFVDYMGGANPGGQLISWCNWSYSDKNESTAAWQAGTCSTGLFTTSTLRTSGTWVRQRILSPADNFNCPSTPNTATPTRTSTPTATATPTRTNTRSATPTLTRSNTDTPTRTQTPLPSSTSTPTRTDTHSPVASSTSTTTFTRTRTRTATTTPSPTPTWTRTSTGTAIPTDTIPYTSTVTRTPTPTATSTGTSTFTRTPTPTSTGTRTLTSTPTRTATTVTTAVGTETPSETPTEAPSLPNMVTPIPYPNPCTKCDDVRILVSVSKAGEKIRVQLFTPAYRKIRETVYRDLPAGLTPLRLDVTDKDGRPLSNGVYYIRVASSKSTAIGKLIVLR